jgi:hypothetical protein
LGTNTPAYLAARSVTEKKSFIFDCRKRKRSPLIEKYLKFQNLKGLTKTFEIWETMNCVDLAKVLNVNSEDVFELVSML